MDSFSIWCVVEYDDGCLTIVPKSWTEVGGTSGTCYWPPRGTFYSDSQYQKAVKRGVNPGPTWPIYGATILGSYDNFETARSKWIKFEHNQDLSTTDAEKEKKSRKKRKKKMNDSSDSSELEETVLSTIKPFPKIQHNTVLQCPSQNENKYSNDLTAYSNKNNIEELILSKEDNSQQLAKKCVKMSPIKTRMKIPEMSDKDFKERVIRDLSINKLKIKKLEEKSNHLERRYSVVNNDDDEESEHDILLATSLPLVDENGLIVIENKLLTDKTFKSYLLKMLTKIGGKKTDEATKLILRRLFTNKLAMMCSWLGGKGKKVFSNLLLSKVILETVLKIVPISTETEIILSIKNWLRHSMKRYENSLKNKKLINAGVVAVIESVN